MKVSVINTRVYNEDCILELMDFDDQDRKNWKLLFDSWKELKMGMRNYKSREPNIPEGLSEVAYCLWSGSSRFISAKKLSSKSFDTFDKKSGLTHQIKACSVESDLTSFGPKSKWDTLIFLDFYNDGKVDGLFDVYELPTDKIHKYHVNKKQTFRDQQLQARRPRFSLKEFIEKEHISPIAKNVKVWL